MIIDIRSPEKYNNDHLDDAVNISYNELFYHPNKYLKKELKYYIYCDTGYRSKVLVNFLNKIGYNCVNIEYANYKANKNIV